MSGAPTSRSDVLTMVTGYSRWLSGLLIPTRTAADLIARRGRARDDTGARQRTPSEFRAAFVSG